MKERPIIFSGEMVRAILEGRKTQTRRVVKPQPVHLPEAYDRVGQTIWPPGCEPGEDGVSWGDKAPIDSPTKVMANHCPYGQSGDRLIVCSYIPGISHTYCAGTNGVIYSRAWGEWKPLKTWHDGKHYPVVTISEGKRKRTKNIHRLLCSAFYGEAPSKSSQVRHLDGNPGNSFPENLAWGTQYENWQDRKLHGNGVEGEKHHFAKFTDEERQCIAWVYDKGIASEKHIARVLGVSQASISEIVNQFISPRPKEFQDIPGNRIPRITLEITNIRVERLRDISEEDAEAEGMNTELAVKLLSGKNYLPYSILVGGMRMLWDSINGKEYPWESNSWVWVIEFKRISDNAMAKT